MEDYKRNIDFIDENGNHGPYFEAMEYLYYGNDSKILGEHSQLMVEMELYDQDLFKRVEDMKK
jgi:hypothetical protein